MKVLGVCYEREYPSILPDDMPAHVLDTILTKADCWEYEQEFRLIGSPELHEDNPLRLDGDYLKLPDLALLSVIVGCNGRYDSVKKTVEQQAPGLRVAQIFRMPNEYKVMMSVPTNGERGKKKISWPQSSCFSPLTKTD